MNCDSISKLIPLYYYGELAPEEEDRIEEHTHSCAGCARELERQRTLAAALDRRSLAPGPFLLEDCRADLMAAIQGGAPRLEKSTRSAWKLFLEAMGGSLAGLDRLRRPVAALALIALGFFASRMTTGLTGGLTTGLTSASPTGSVLPATSAGFVPDEALSTVRSVRPDPSGHVEIAFDETRRHVVSGRMDDSNIQRLLLAAAHGDNEAVRVESMDLLRARAGSTEVRDAFINAMFDTNAGVRWKALEGLKPLAGDAEVRKTLARVLLSDDNYAIRMQAVDLLVSRRDESTVGMLQDLVQKEDNNAVRLKVAKALKDMNASVGTF
ncbi:MAG TPA: HEAT repeat domain-containing protein [Candidatus Acidoferrales bacterium]|jgi:anti-sigma factor RsiW|nr:HEAT repeat domain-containing protein [Candidatus Acidoferrales bacterium]